MLTSAYWPAERTGAVEDQCRQHLAPHKRPRHWRFVDTFPLTGSGKIQKYRLREEFAPGPT